MKYNTELKFMKIICHDIYSVLSCCIFFYIRAIIKVFKVIAYF